VTLTASDANGGTVTGTTSTSVTVSSSSGYYGPYITTPYLSIPNFGAKPSIVSVTSGNWSNPTTWSLGRVPQAGDIVDINPGTTVTYDVNDASNAIPLNTVEVQPSATLTFATTISTQICVANFVVLQGGSLVVGTAANPIAASVNANIDIANQALNTSTDPNQFGDGLIALGNVTMHGASKSTYGTLAQEAHAGDTVLHFATPVSGWQAGDDPLLPDTRQLNFAVTDGSNYRSEAERVTIQSVSADGLTVYLTAPLKYDHLGAHDAMGVLQYLPQVMNDSTNIMVQSQSFTGTRGYTLFTDRANVDIENAGFCELGRTTNTAASSTNVPDRYAMTLLDLIGPSTPQANGHQFTLIGNEVDNDGDGNPKNPSNIQWGIALNNSFYGLIQDNVVYAVAGVGIGVEDAASSYNTFDHNMVAGVSGTSVRLDQTLQGDGYWFHNPNNYVTNNIATNINPGGGDAYSYGFDIDCQYDGTVTVPAYQGADPSVAGQGRSVNMNDTPILAFSGNTLYGASKMGMTLWWIGTVADNFYTDTPVSTVKNFVAWNFSINGIFLYSTNNVTIDGAVLLGDANQVNNQFSVVQGITYDDYMTRNGVVTNVNIQDMATGISVPQNVGRVPAIGTYTIENSYLDNVTNIDVGHINNSNGGSGLSGRLVVIQNVEFAHPSGAPSSWWSDISMDDSETYDPSFYNNSVSDQVMVYAYNGNSQDNFEVYYASNKPAKAVNRALVGWEVPF
jgi:hypothetical protein